MKYQIDGHKFYLQPMTYGDKLADRIRERFASLENVEEKSMMGGLVFMYNGKMCVGIFKGDLMCRIHKDFHDEAVKKQGCRTMDFSNRPMTGYVVIDERGIKSKKDFDYWIDLALAYNDHAKASKKPVQSSAKKPNKK